MSHQIANSIRADTNNGYLHRTPSGAGLLATRGHFLHGLNYHKWVLEQEEFIQQEVLATKMDFIKNFIL